MHDVIRETLMIIFDGRASNVPILYGGSVNPLNCQDYASLTQVNGLFVGRAAWSPEGFVEVLGLGLEANKKAQNDCSKA